MSFTWSNGVAAVLLNAAAGAAITADAAITIGAVTVSSEATVQPRPGTTIAALAAGSTSSKCVVALEGYQYLFTDATPTEATSAWDGRDWTLTTGALTGCTFDVRHEQRINPWDPFTSGGKLTFAVPAQSPGNTAAADPFGVDFRRKTAGDENVLNATIDSNDTTATVLSTTGFASSGTMYVGTEAIGYSGVTATTFTGLTRGKWAPFGVDGGAASRFGHQHTVAIDPNAIKLKPLVTEQPRIWRGKWVGMWRHLYNAETGLLNTRADARLEFAGRVVEMADDPATMRTVVHCEHALDYVKRAVLGRDLWSARVKEGIRLFPTASQPGMQFDMHDYNGTTGRDANPLTVVSGNPASVNEIKAGIYTIHELASKITDWLSAEKIAARLHGTYWITVAASSSGTWHTWFNWKIPGTNMCGGSFVLPEDVDRMFGTISDQGASLGRRMVYMSNVEPSVEDDRRSDNTPLRNMVSNNWNGIEVTEEAGTRVDQTSSLPWWAQSGNGTNNGGFLIDGKWVVFGKYSSGEITQITAISAVQGTLPDQDVPLDAPQAIVSIKQILCVEDTWANAIKKLFYSTGTTGYNHATYDAYPVQLSLGIPGEILGDAFENSVDALPGALNTAFTLFLDEPKRLDEILKGALIFRWSFLRWQDEGIQFRTWTSPTTGDALTEGNKAAASGQDDNHRAATVLTGEWARPIIKLDYDRDVRASGQNDGFRSSITIADHTAIEDAGGDAKPFTIQLRDSFSTADVQALKAQFQSGAAMFTRDVSKITRSIDSRFFEGYGVGDCVLVTDTFAGDPDTGLRGVATRPGIIIGHRWTLGGAGANGAVSPASGEVDIMFRDLLRIGTYVHTAQLDDTAASNGYIIGTKVATCYAHRFSESSEAADATRFPAGAKIRMLEIDPPDPAAPSTHDDTVASQSGNTITLTTGFAGYDDTKLYKIISDTYGDASATQQGAQAYQADDADGMVADARRPYQYVATFVNLADTYTANAANDPIELPASSTYGDGVGRDVGTEASVNRLIDNLIDLKTAHSKPTIYAELSGASATGTYVLLDSYPICIGGLINSTTVNRSMSTTVMMKSSDGASASVRVSLCRFPPSGTTIQDVDRGQVYAEATFTVTSTTYAQVTAQNIAIGGIPPALSGGEMWVVMEATVKARTYGVVKLQVGARTA